MEKTELIACHRTAGNDTITREVFCKLVDVLLKYAPDHVRNFFKDFANDPETTDGEIQEITDVMLNKLNENTIAQC
ncbi:MAG: hypothetical protein AAB497_02495 [Patescibacteria group bacterium]